MRHKVDSSDICMLQKTWQNTIGQEAYLRYLCTYLMGFAQGP